MNKLMVVLLTLALAAPASAWTILGDNILGNNFDYVTLRSPNNGDSIVFNATTGKWEAGSASGSISIQTDGVAQGTASTLNFSNGLSASGGATGNVSPTYGTAANTITQGNDARHNVTPAAGVRGNIPVVNAAGTAYTSIDEGTATDQALMSLGANTPGAFRALIATDIDELLTVEQLVDVDITSLAAHHMLVRNGSSKWVNAVWAGDVTGTVAANTFATLIANDAVTDAKLRNASGLSFIGRATSTVGDPGDIDGTANQIPIVDSAGNTLDFRTISGDLTNATGVFTIANQAVSPAKMADLAALSLLGRSASTSGVMAAITGTANQIPIVDSGGTALAFTTLSGDVTNASGVMTIANNAVSNAKFRQGAARSLVGVAGNATANVADIQGTANQIPIVNSAGNALAFTTLSGDVTNSGGVMTIANNAVSLAKMATIADDRILGNDSGSTAVPSALTFGGSPSDPGTAAASGSSSAVPRLDHTHNSILPATTSDPTNEREYSYDTDDDVMQVKYAIGRVTVPGVFFKVNADSTTVTAGGETTFSNGSSPSWTPVAGQQITFEMSGTLVADGTASTHNFEIKKGSTTIMSLNMNPVSSTSNTFRVTGTISCRSSTTVYVSAQGVLGNSTFGNRNYNGADVGTGTVTISSSAEQLHFVTDQAVGSGDSVVLKLGWMAIQ